MEHGTIHKVGLLLLLVIVFVGCVLFCFFYEYYFGIVLFVPAIIITSISILKTIKHYTEKVTFMFNAIENDDYTFKFSESVNSTNDQMFNRSLNRMKEMMVKARNEQAERENYYEKILNHISIGIIVVDPQTGIVFQSNRAAQEILGIETLTHVNQLSILSSEIPQKLLTIEAGQNSSINFYNETSNVYLSLAASTVVLNGRTLKAVSMSNIVNQIDNTQTDSWMRLSRVLTHEIMNSLAPITSLSEQLLNTTDPQTLHKGLEIIGSTSKGLVTFVDNYRQLTRIPIPVVEEFSFYDFLLRQISLFDREIHIAEVDKNMTLQADENLMSQLFTNLIKNAIEATESCGKIWIASHRDSRGRNVVEVCNNGEPIDKAILENIFVPFFTTKQGGSGIGLSISRQIMRLHNGTLTYSNHGGVTRFTINFT